jgi:tryptophanyl-tRNA synthetase
MSKTSDSDSGLITMTDDPAAIMRKFKRAVTDSDNEVRYDPVGKPGVSNLLEILGAATRTKPTDLAAAYTQYGRLKTDAGEAIVTLLEPIQQRYAELLDDPAELTRLLRVGSAKARAVASKTLERAYSAIGLLPA